MPAEYPFQMIGRVPVIKAPAEIDITTSGELRTVLLQWHVRGHTTMVVDLTGTVFCDMAGLHGLERAHDRARSHGGGLRLVIPADGAFARIFTITGLDRVIPHSATVEHALAQLTGVAARPVARVPEREVPVGDSRRCAQCGEVFVPVREHARFCTTECRAAWNQEHLGDPAVDASALTWSIAAMSDATARLPAMRAWDKPQAFAAIRDAVWWVTMVDATLVRHHPRAYDAVLAAHTPAERRLIYETLAGLRFVRNSITQEAGLGDVIEAAAGTRRITGWTWKPVPESALGWLPPRAHAWERTRWQAYQARLASHTIGKTFGQSVTFLTLTGADAASSTHTS